MHKRSSFFVSAVLVGCLVTASHAANMRFLNDTPITYLKPKDKTALVAEADSVLTNKADGETQQWSNKSLGNSVIIDAELSATDTVKTDAKTCRRLHIVLHAKGQDQTLSIPVCKTADGNWTVQKR
ncbi:DVU3141 family protein [Collimonas arenae]|uniref:DVU3141 family protein n=1 Tax=Collimonas arenae TaxID=279058 RepID=UPI0007782A5E|nr:DVU3141 family protein [Collimonas arenae]